MRDRLIELLKDPIPVIRGLKIFGESRMSAVDAERYADHLLANGVIVPPCKVGDTVYTILRGKIFCYTVLEYSVRGKCGSVYAENDRDFLDFPFAELGKNVFLTREEAEQALKGEHNG